MDWTQEEYDRLTAHYRDCSDERLGQLASHPDELTMIACELLNKELKQRNIDMPARAVTLSEGEQEPVASEDEMELLWKYASLAPEECTFFFKTDREAYAASALLLEAGIPNVIIGDREVIKNDLRTVRTVVRPGDEARAAALLDAPLPERLFEEVDADPGDFVEPVCPTCGSADPLLQTNEPTNVWFCEECGHTWQDTLPETEKAGR